MVGCGSEGNGSKMRWWWFVRGGYVKRGGGGQWEAATLKHWEQNTSRGSRGEHVKHQVLQGKRLRTDDRRGGAGGG